MKLADVTKIFEGSDGDATKMLYAQLDKIGVIGTIAVNLLRACKTSERAKKYRGGQRGRGSYRSMAYDRKSWSIENLCRFLAEHPTGILWGWGIDEGLKARGDPHHHVLYVELPTGQVSFHNGTNYGGPIFAKRWDGARGTSPRRICRWAALLLGDESIELPATSDTCDAVEEETSLPPKVETLDELFAFIDGPALL